MPKEIDWDDDSIKPKNNTEFSERTFSLESGREDQIKIIGNPIIFKRHWIPENRRYVNCPETDACPACARGYEAHASFATTIVHIASKKGKAVQKIGLTKVWIFGDAAKYEMIKEMKRNYAPEGDLKKLEIRITCTDSGFQKIGGMYPVLDAAKKLMDQSMLADVKENRDLLQKFIKPRTTADIEKVLETVSEAAPAEAEDVLDEEEVPAKPAPKVAAKVAAKPVAKVAAKQPVEEPSDDSDIDAEIESLLQ
jgi:hypothetical protein